MPKLNLSRAKCTDDILFCLADPAIRVNTVFHHNNATSVNPPTSGKGSATIRYQSHTQTLLRRNIHTSITVPRLLSIQDLWDTPHKVLPTDTDEDSTIAKSLYTTQTEEVCTHEHAYRAPPKTCPSRKHFTLSGFSHRTGICNGYEWDKFFLTECSNERSQYFGGQHFSFGSFRHGKHHRSPAPSTSSILVSNPSYLTAENGGSTPSERRAGIRSVLAEYRAAGSRYRRDRTRSSATDTVIQDREAYTTSNRCAGQSIDVTRRRAEKAARSSQPIIAHTHSSSHFCACLSNVTHEQIYISLIFCYTGYVRVYQGCQRSTKYTDTPAGYHLQISHPRREGTSCLHAQGTYVCQAPAQCFLAMVSLQINPSQAPPQQQGYNTGFASINNILETNELYTGTEPTVRREKVKPLRYVRCTRYICTHGLTDIAMNVPDLLPCLLLTEIQRKNASTGKDPKVMRPLSTRKTAL